MRCHYCGQSPYPPPVERPRPELPVRLAPPEEPHTLDAVVLVAVGIAAVATMLGWMVGC